MKWLLRIWHRFTLGRTATPWPITYSNRAHPGSTGDLAHRLLDEARRRVPAGVQVSVCIRAATDLPPRQIRIVIEGQ